MASTTDFDKPRASLPAMLAVPFLALGRFMIFIAETSPKARQIERLQTVSDAELARCGLTREGEIRRILGTAAAI